MDPSTTVIYTYDTLCPFATLFRSYSLWGVWAVVIGILFLGGGVVPMALLATMFKGLWDPFFTLLVLAIITLASRGIGMSIASRSEEHTSELQSLMRNSSAVFCLKKTISSLTSHTKRTVQISL